MARISFTAGKVAGFKCPAGKSQSFLWDAGAVGLGLRTTLNGKPSYVFQGVYAGKDVRIVIGSPEAWSIPDARAKAREMQREIDEGRDPRQLKRDALALRAAAVEQEAVLKHEALAQSLTVGAVWPLYLEHGRGKRAKEWKPRYRADLESMATPGGVQKRRGKGLTRPGPLFPLMGLPLACVDEDRLAAWHRAEAQSGPHQAARALMMFRGFLRWCSTRPEYRSLAKRDAAAAPAVVENLPSASRRTDALETLQIAPWWDAVTNLSNQIASVYLRALLLTGARREELAGVKWDDIDFRWKRLTIADKVGATRTLPLTPYMEQMFCELPRTNNFVFASKAKAGRIADVRSSHNKALAAVGIGHLTLHGLRRSFSLLGEAAGAPAGAIAQVMGHRPSAVAEGYRPRSVDALRPYLARVELHILELASAPIERLEAL